MLNIIIFGPPGAGKGTQSEGLIDKYELTHLSTGDVFRKNIGEQTELGVLAKQFIDKGELVPDSVTIGMVENFVAENSDGNGFIFDGFPRTIEQGEALDAFLSSRNEEISIVLALEVDEDELVRRLLERGKTSGRKDDASEDTIRNRFQEYANKTEPLLEFYEKQNKCVRVKGVGSIESIFSDLCKAVDGLNDK